MVVLGDSLARGLWHGLYTTYRRTRDVEVVREAKSATGLVRDDEYDWFARANDVVRGEKIDVAVVLIGGNDRQDIRDGRQRHERMGEAWQEAYAKRVSRFMQTFTERGIKIYWVGLPTVRSGRMERDYAVMNRIFQSEAARHGATFIDIFSEFRDARGRYQAHGPDLDGRTRQIRDNDGLHFTTPGYLVLASIVAARIAEDRPSGPIAHFGPAAKRN